jgi:WD40 repeat protein
MTNSNWISMTIAAYPCVINATTNEEKPVTKNKFVAKTMPFLLGFLALIACNTVLDDSKPIQPNAVPQLKIKWTEETITTAPWSSIFDIAWKPDGSSIAVADSDKTYLTSNDTTPTFQQIQNLSAGIAWQQNGQQIVGQNGTQFVIANLETGNQFTINKGGWFRFNTPIAFSPDGRFIIGIQSAYNGSGAVIVVDTTTGQIIQSLDSQDQIFALGYNNAGDKVLIVGLGGGLYDATTLNTIFSFSDGEIPVAGDFSPSGNQYAVAYFKQLADDSINYRVAIHNTQTGALENSIALTKLPTNLKWSPNGTQIGFGFNNGIISIWDVSTGTIVQDLPIQSARIIDFEWHPSGSPIAVVSDNTLVFYNATSGDEERCISPTGTPNAYQRSNNVYGLAYNPKYLPKML